MIHVPPFMGPVPVRVAPRLAPLLEEAGFSFRVGAEADYEIFFGWNPGALAKMRESARIYIFREHPDECLIVMHDSEGQYDRQKGYWVLVHHELVNYVPLVWFLEGCGILLPQGLLHCQEMFVLEYFSDSMLAETKDKFSFTRETAPEGMLYILTDNEKPNPMRLAIEKCGDSETGETRYYVALDYKKRLGLFYNRAFVHEIREWLRLIAGPSVVHRR